MSPPPPVLHLICGKVASGKSTLASKLGATPKTVVISEDAWLATLFADELSSLSDYKRCTARLEKAIGPHIVDLLSAGISVVLDFQANTTARRAWMRGLVQASQAGHKLHYLDVPTATCKSRLRARTKRGDHPFSVTDAQFDQLLKHFVAPTAEEGFDVVVYQSDDLS